jgi:hypothetical protein
VPSQQAARAADSRQTLDQKHKLGSQTCICCWCGWCCCRHPHIVELREMFLTPLHLAAVSEYVDGEDLQMFLANTGGRCVLWQYSTAIVAFAVCLLLIRRWRGPADVSVQHRRQVCVVAIVVSNSWCTRMQWCRWARTDHIARGLQNHRQISLFLGPYLP